MSIRDTINKNPQLALGIAGGTLFLGLLLLIWQLWPQKAVAAQPGRGFFTTDDGKSYFEDDVWKISPQQNGKESVRAHVFRCGDAGKPFVGWLERYKPEAKVKLARFYQDSANRTKFPPEYYEDAGREYAKIIPGRPLVWKQWSSEVLMLGAINCREANTLATEIFPARP